MTQLGWLFCLAAVTAVPAVSLDDNPSDGKLTVALDGREAFTYQYGSQFAIPHFWPVRSPAGQLLTTQHPEPYPHHRSIWIADRVRGAQGPAVDFYHCWKNYRQPDNPAAGYRHFIRHVRFGKVEVDGGQAIVTAELQWIVNDDVPILDETRTWHTLSLGQGEYLVDLQWELKANHGDVRFLSDDVHYAWPFVRMHPQFSAEHGGVITNDRGKRGQAETHGQAAKWIDFSGTVGETTEGLAVLLPSDDGPRTWLTRDYGTFGPRRDVAHSGKEFVLASGASLRGRAAILVHRGNVESGQVAKRYQQYLQFIDESSHP
ncbi:MAG: PmoA family protein [Planctomycetales bacterium]|nr:PmoA family protein [Planctomycetales bacterium]